MTATSMLALVSGFSVSSSITRPLLTRAVTGARLPLRYVSTVANARKPLTTRLWSMKEGDQKPFVLTTPLYYANGPPHMGSAYPTMAADVIARYQKLAGRDPIFICGSDEHGEKIATTAADKGQEPKEFVDNIVSQFKALWKDLGIEYDSFIRTTDDKHEAIVREFFQRVWDKGDIYKKNYEGRYCVGCEAYLSEEEMETIDGKEHCCKIHRKPAELRKEENYFFRLSKYQEDLENLFKEKPEFVQPSYRFNEVKQWVKAGVPDFSISRATIKWGIPVPEDNSQVIYVWFDALLGYISALLKDGDPATLQTAIDRGWPCDVHVIGKDILRFHAVYWPAMLMSAGLPMPNLIYSHGFITKDGLKMGKSLGNVLEPSELVQKYGKEAVRYYFTKGLEFGGDGDFSEDRFVYTINADLANDIGNLLNRCLKPLLKNNGPAYPKHVTPADHPLRAIVLEQTAKCAEAYQVLDFKAAGEAALEIARAGNKYMDDSAPWTLFKEGKIEEGNKCLLTILEATRIVAVLLSPIVPETCAKIYQQLGFSAEQWDKVSWSDAVWRDLPEGQHLAEPMPIFNKLELPGEVEARAKEQEEKKKAQKAAAKQGAAVEAEDVLRLDIRVGKILSAEKHPDADSLYVEMIDCGDGEPRQVVSGLAKYIPLEEMQGRMVTVLCNLKPAKMRGVDSAAMVLAAGTEQVELVTPPEGAKVGERLTIEGMSEPTPDEQLKSKAQLKVWDRVVEKLSTDGACIAKYDGKALLTSAGPCFVKSLTGAPIK